MALHLTSSVSTLGGPVNPQVIVIDLRGIYFGSYSEALSKLSFISVISTKENWFVKSFKCSKTEELSSNMTQAGSQPLLNPPQASCHGSVSVLMMICGYL